MLDESTEVISRAYLDVQLEPAEVAEALEHVATRGAKRASLSNTLRAYWLKWTGSPLFDAYTLETFSSVSVEICKGEKRTALLTADFAIRGETGRCFVLARADGSIGLVVPKRVFPDAASTHAFRAVTKAP